MKETYTAKEIASAKKLTDLAIREREEGCTMEVVADHVMKNACRADAWKTALGVFLKFYLHPCRPPLSVAWHYMAEQLECASLPVPSCRTIRRLLHKHLQQHPNILAARRG